MLVTIGLLTAGVFALDVALPLGHVMWLLYVLPLWLSARMASPVTSFRYASLCTILLATGLWCSPRGVEVVTAIVKVEAFPFTRYGTIDAEVARVSREAVEDPSQGGEGGGRSGGAAAVTRVQNLVFLVTLRLGRRVIDVDGTEVLLGPGMQVTVEIKTGQRRVIDYVLSPLREVAARTGRER